MKKLFPTLLVALAVLPLGGCQSFEYDYAPVSNENGSVFYEIFVGSFYDSDGDGMGDLAGVQAKLEYLEDFGVSGIWFMPIHPSPTYHKYDVIDYYAIAPEYGTMADFENFVEAASNKGINTIIDLVVNHSSNRHPWFIAASSAMRNGTCAMPNSYCNYYNWSDKFAPGYERLTSTIYYEARFWSGMPDLNLDDLEVRSEIANIVEFWLDKGVKGFRLDAVTSYYTGFESKNLEFLTWLNNTVKAIEPNAYIVGEGPWGSLAAQISAYYTTGIDSYFNFPISVQTTRMYQNVRQANGAALSAFVVDYTNQIKALNPNALDAPFLSNHDQNRVGGLMFPENADESRKLMGSIYLLMPGRPFVYYGEEIIMRGSGIDENKRLPMIWSQTDKTGQTDLPNGATYDMKLQVQLGAHDQREIADSLLNHYRKVINVRNQYNDYIEKATVTQVGTDPRIYGLEYETDAGFLTILTNTSAETIEETLTGNYQLLTDIPTSKAHVTITQQGGKTIVKIPPFASAVLSI